MKTRSKSEKSKREVEMKKTARRMTMGAAPESMPLEISSERARRSSNPGFQPRMYQILGELKPKPRGVLEDSRRSIKNVNSVFNKYNLTQVFIQLKRLSAKIIEKHNRVNTVKESKVPVEVVEDPPRRQSTRKRKLTTKFADGDDQEPLGVQVFKIARRCRENQNNKKPITLENQMENEAISTSVASDSFLKQAGQPQVSYTGEEVVGDKTVSTSNSCSPTRSPRRPRERGILRGSKRGTRGGRRSRGGRRVPATPQEGKTRKVKVLQPPKPSLQVFEEETRMSATTDAEQPSTATSSVGQPEADDTTQVSNISSTNTSAAGLAEKLKKVNRELTEERKPVTAETLFEYGWPDEPNADHYMLQEQVSEYLGVKSFKRKYPDLPRRVVDMEEKDFLRHRKIVSEIQCDLGLTALSSADVLDIMLNDFPEKYEEYRRAIQEGRELGVLQPTLNEAQCDSVLTVPDNNVIAERENIEQDVSEDPLSATAQPDASNTIIKEVPTLPIVKRRIKSILKCKGETQRKTTIADVFIIGEKASVYRHYDRIEKDHREEALKNKDRYFASRKNKLLLDKKPERKMDWWDKVKERKDSEKRFTAWNDTYYRCYVRPLKRAPTNEQVRVWLRGFQEKYKGVEITRENIYDEYCAVYGECEIYKNMLQIERTNPPLVVEREMMEKMVHYGPLATLILLREENGEDDDPSDGAPIILKGNMQYIQASATSAPQEEDLQVLT